MAQRESPTEVFKRALAHAARSLAEQPDLEVVFSGDGPSLSGHRAVLPHPPRELSGPETTRIRGLADQLALRVGYHDDAVHGRARPKSIEGQQVYDALEQARIEAIGANALAGVRDNLNAVWEQAIQRKGLDHLVDPAAAPMADILALMARERLTGQPPPPSARALVDAFRDQIEAKAGPDLDRLTESLDNQRAFARIARAIVRDMELGDDLSDAPDQDSQDEESEEGEAEASDEGEGEGEEQSPQSATMDDSEKTHRESDTSESTMTETEEDENAEPSDEELETGD